MMNRDELKADAARKDEERKSAWRALMDQDDDDMDEDGYPTELACERIKAWHWSDKSGWLKYIESLWHLASWGWSEGDEPHDYKDGVTVRRFHISTAGWSGNETLIQAMKENTMLWHLTWVQSRRGGHYIFEIDKEITE